MTTITLPRATVEQALEALRYFRDTAICSADTDTANEVIPALEAALAQQAEPVAYTTGHCENHKQKGGCQLHNLQCGWPDCDRKPSAALAQQAEPEPQTCTWQQDGDSDSGVYSTSCRRYFNLEDGTPEDNQMAWCCYCGKKLVQELIAEDEHD